MCLGLLGDAHGLNWFSDAHAPSLEKWVRPILCNNDSFPWRCGSVSFGPRFYLVNWPDRDIQRYSWQVGEAEKTSVLEDHFKLFNVLHRVIAWNQLRSLTQSCAFYII